jgi:hypothetical protein
MEYGLRTELMNELNMLKNALKDAEAHGEISRTERCKIMNCIGQMKGILYGDLVFKEIYSKQEHKLFV